jgi:hypothetical protein
MALNITARNVETRHGRKTQGPAQCQYIAHYAGTCYAEYVKHGIVLVTIIMLSIFMLGRLYLNK